MEKIQKKKSSFLFDLEFKLINREEPSHIIYFLIFLINIFCESLTLFEFNRLGQQTPLSFPDITLFYFEVGLLALFIIVTLIAYFKLVLKSIWIYLLLVVEALTPLYIRSTCLCFVDGGWCEGEIKFQIGNAAVLAFVGLTILSLKSMCYYPFYDNENLLSMEQRYTSIFLFFYRLVFGIFSYFKIFSLFEVQTKAVLILCLALYFFARDTGYRNPFALKLWNLFYLYILWTCSISFLVFGFDYLSGGFFNRTVFFWYLWGYPLPFVLIISLTSKIQLKKNSWRKLLYQKNHTVLENQNIYLLCNQLQNHIKKIRKSQLKSKDPDFKELWELVEWHGLDCSLPTCPIQQLKTVLVRRNDEFLEQKRLTKTIQSSLQFGKFMLERMRLENPNNIGLMIEIAFYELEALQNKQKGLFLYNEYNSKNELTYHHRYSIFFLKKKIDEMYVGNGKFSKANADTEISQFRHKVEVSVTMLAQFWYFLADPKCNLKKLYDLANILFPLKIGVQNDWEHIKRLKNIQSYNFYAKYLIKMFNDKEKGMKILEEAKAIEEELKQREQIQLNPDGNDHTVAEETGIIFLEFDGKNSGTMYQVSLNIQKIFGYHKGELLNQKVNEIMPTVYADFHDRILDNYQQTNKSIMMNKERQIWGKSRNGYIFPFTILIKPVSNFYSQTSQVYASVKKELWLKQIGAIVLDVDEMISEISSTILNIFPTLYGKVPGKKKVNISEVLPNFEEIKEKILVHNEVYEHTITRQFYLSRTKTTTQETVFSVGLEEINIQIAGKIGYLMKFSKMSTLTKKQPEDEYEEDPTKKFMFTYNFPQDFKSPSLKSKQQVGEEGQKSAKRIVEYVGGLFESFGILQTLMNSSTTYFLEKVKKKTSESCIKFQNYSENIKTKRLFHQQIKEIHDDEEDESFKAMEEEKQNSTNLFVGQVKPSDLGLILERQASNKTITYLKVLTFFILATSSAAYIIQYSLVRDIETNIMVNIQNLRKVNELEAQILYLKRYSTRFSVYNYTQAEEDKLLADINQLDGYLDNYEFNFNAKIVYKDFSFDNYYLGFGLSKLVSEANSLKETSGLFDSSQSNVFFVKYNTVNGLYEGIQKQKDFLLKQVLSNFNSITEMHLIFLLIMAFFLIICLIIKNCMLRSVTKKKAKILEVFFQIPRRSCSFIQKQCERFILKLSSDDDNVDVNSDVSDQEGGDLAQKKNHTQKKRTIIGEEKTANNFIINTILFLVLLMIFHIFSLLKEEVKKENLEYSSNAIYEFFQLEQSVSKMINFMVIFTLSQNSYVEDPTFPINGSLDHLQVISKEKEHILDKYTDIRVLYYKISDILDDQFLKKGNKILYENICSSNCTDEYAENQGISSVLIKYVRFIQWKYDLLIQNYTSVTSAERLDFLSEANLDKQQNFQLIIKDAWRKMTIILQNGLSRYISSTEIISFGIMLGLCIFNFTVLLFVWMKFYQNLEQKITATEYILTFIPIDEINKNPKIAQYIKEEILEKR